MQQRSPNQIAKNGGSPILLIRHALLRAGASYGGSPILLIRHTVFRAGVSLGGKMVLVHALSLILLQ
jgi:hypothetical protein